MVGENLRRSFDEATLKRLPKGLTAVSVKGRRYILVPLSAEFIPNQGGNTDFYSSRMSFWRSGRYFLKEETSMKYEILKLLARNAKYTAEDIAVMLGADEKTVESEIKQLEKDGLIKGYKAIIDWQKVENPYVSAIIELNVVPKAGLGFEEVAEKIMKYDEVESVYLMSGVYDLNVVVKAKTLQDIARFVARELATIDSVTSTTTHFVLRRYKEMDVELVSKEDDGRGQLFI